MARCFNVSGPCRTDKHYMVNLLFRLEEIRQMIDDGEYFVINKAIWEDDSITFACRISKKGLSGLEL